MPLSLEGCSLEGQVQGSPSNHYSALDHRGCCHTCYRHFGHKTLRPQDTSAPRHFSTTKLVPEFKTVSCVSPELSWVEVSRLFLDHGTRVEVSRTTFLVSKCLETGAEVSQSVLRPKCLVADMSGNSYRLLSGWVRVGMCPSYHGLGNMQIQFF